MSKKQAHIAGVIMCKNETKRILITLKSLVGVIDSLVIYDTGSTDDTIEKITEFAERNKIPLHLKQANIPREEFEYGPQRSIMLEFADTFPEQDFQLWMDVNDELRESKPGSLRTFANEMLDQKYDGFLMCQEWFSGNYVKYWNMRFVRSRSGWRFKGRIHEWPKNIKRERDEDGPQAYRIDFPDHPILYQDRTQDDDKTGKRFPNDKKLLLKDYQDDPSDTRTLFYLAQTCGCLEQFDEAFYYYKLRAELEGFWEERFHALNRCGEYSVKMGHPWVDSMGYFIRAFEVSPRVEPMIEITRHYMAEKNWLLAFTFCDLACKLTYPSHLLLFVNKQEYEYDRWHLMGIIGYHAGFHNEGKSACLRALECKRLRHPLDEENLRKYQEKEREKENRELQVLTKQQFIDKTCTEVLLTNPRMNKRELESKASVLWKLKSQQLEREKREKAERERLEREKDQEKTTGTEKRRKNRKK